MNLLEILSTVPNFSAYFVWQTFLKLRQVNRAGRLLVNSTIRISLYTGNNRERDFLRRLIETNSSLLQRIVFLHSSPFEKRLLRLLNGHPLTGVETLIVSHSFIFVASDFPSCQNYQFKRVSPLAWEEGIGPYRMGKYLEELNSDYFLMVKEEFARNEMDDHVVWAACRNLIQEERTNQLFIYLDWWYQKPCPLYIKEFPRFREKFVDAFTREERERLDQIFASSLVAEVDHLQEKSSNEVAN